ncbi:MAG: DUF4854 domain-containing protein [Lachnospiraceae bacterium]|nr:DUF4854 domain-containing protein [Lachnospiraceae bacterium]
MKRKTLKFLACAAIMAMTLSVTACGGSDKDDKAAGTEAPAGDETDAADDTETDAADDANADAADDANADAADDTEADAADASGTTLEELFNDPTAKATFDSMTQAMTQEGMSASISVTGNELIMEVKIEDSALITDGIGETLGTALDAQAETLKTQVKTLDAAVGQEGACTYTVRYLDPDGNVLTEKSFKAE